MLASVKSFALEGLSGYAVSVEVDIGSGLPSVETVGLASTATKESKERVRAAIRNSGYPYPSGRITVNLAPADTKKEGASLDLPIAVGLLVCAEAVAGNLYKDYVMIGELALDGSLRSVNGVMPLLISAMQQGEKKFIVPAANAKEASYIEGIEVQAFATLHETVDFLSGGAHEPVPETGYRSRGGTSAYGVDMSDVKGQTVGQVNRKTTANPRERRRKNSPPTRVIPRYHSVGSPPFTVKKPLRFTFEDNTFTALDAMRPGMFLIMFSRCLIWTRRQP